MKKKVAFLTTTLNGGGAQRAVANITNALDKNLFEVYVIVFDGTKQTYGFDNKIIDLKLPASKNIINKLINFFRRYNKLKKLKKNESFDCVVSFLSMPNFLNLLTRVKGTKNYISIRNYIAFNRNGFYSLVNDLFRKKLYNKADNIIAVSEAIKLDIVQRYNLKENLVQVIHNGYPVDSIAAESKATINDDISGLFNGSTVITSGRLSYQKSQWLLIEAIKEVKKVLPEVQLLIMGTGNYEKQLKNQVETSGLIQNVHFLGYVKNPFKYISRSNVFVLTSLYEGFPNVLAEAMACNVPVISTDCLTGPREILAPKLMGKEITDYSSIGEYGLLIDRPVQSEKLKDNETVVRNLADKLILLLTNPKEVSYYKKQSGSRIKDFDINNIVKKWENLLLNGDV